MEPELEAVRVEGHRGTAWTLAEHAASLAEPAPVEGCRFLPLGLDPVLAGEPEHLVPTVAWRRWIWPPRPRSKEWRSTTVYLVAPGGAVLLDGEFVAIFHRKQDHVTVVPFAPVGAKDRARIEDEAYSIPVPGSPDMSVSWQTNPARS